MFCCDNINITNEGAGVFDKIRQNLIHNNKNCHTMRLTKFFIKYII